LAVHTEGSLGTLLTNWGCIPLSPAMSWLHLASAPAPVYWTIRAPLVGKFSLYEYAHEFAVWAEPVEPQEASNGAANRVDSNVLVILRIPNLRIAPCDKRSRHAAHPRMPYRDLWLNEWTSLYHHARAGYHRV
jgi:hypothetical protein